MRSNTRSKTATPVRVGVFRSLAAADHAVESLLKDGFAAERISVICLGCAADAFPPGVGRERPAGSRRREAVLGGGALGAVLGGLTAGVGIAGSGGLGLLVVGPLLGAAGAGAVTGGFIGAMTTRGFEHAIADSYDQALGKGYILVAVDTEAGASSRSRSSGTSGTPGSEAGDRDSRARRAERLLRESGAEPLALPGG